MNKNKTKASSDNVGNSLMKSIAITPPIYNYVLIGILITCVIALVWGIFGSIPQRVKGVGMINTVEGLERVTASASGRITEVKVKIKDQVKAGDIIAIIDQPDVKSSIDQMRFSIEKLKQNNVISSAGNTKSNTIETKSNNLAIKRLMSNLDEANKSIQFHEKRLIQEKGLYEKGLITYAQYFATQQQLASDKINKINIEEQLSQITLKKEKTALDSNLNELNINKQLGLLELELEDMLKEYKLKSEITAQTDGYISQLNVKVGDIISPDFIVGLITAEDEAKNNYILNLYVPFNSNAVISEGMTVDVQIFSIDPYLNGYLQGKVKRVSQYMSDTDGLINTLGNKNLIEFIDSKGGVYGLIVELEKDPKTFNGYSWSNNKGPKTKIYPGQLSLAYVNVKVKAPVDFILPIFEAYFD